MTNPHRATSRLPRRSRRRAAIGVALSLALLAGACGDDGDSTSADPSTSDGSTTTDAGSGGSGGGADEFCTAERAGGQLTMSVFSETRSMDPAVSTGNGTTGGTELAALYDTLVRFNPETSEFEPWLAESLEPNDDFSSWTITLRPDVTFGNGDPLTAEVVKASIERHTAQGSVSTVKAELAQVKAIEVVDELTVRFDLVESWGTFPYVLADMAGMIVNPRVVAERGAEFQYNAAGAGTGPFEFVHFRPGEELVYEARDDYWGGPVCIERLRFIDIVGEPATYEAMKAGSIDVAYFREPDTAPTARADGFDIISEVVWLSQGLLINHSIGDPVTADVTIRKAVAHALDPEVLSERAFGGNLITTTAIAPETSPYAADEPGLQYDPDEAKRLVAEAKAAGWDGSISLVCPETSQQVGLAFETMLNAAGFSTKRENLTIGEFASRVYVDRNYELACGGAGASEASPWVRLARFYGPNNYFTGFQNEEFTAALRDLRIAATPADAAPAIAEMQRVWNESVPSVSLGAIEAGILKQDHVHGILPNVNMVVTFAKAYVDK